MTDAAGRTAAWRAPRDAGLAILMSLAVALACLLGPAGPVWGQGFDYKLGSGDRLRITVFGHEDLSGEFEIGPSGTIAFPLVGEIRVSDTTLRETEQAIVGALKPDYLKNPRVAVEVLNYRPFYIIGEVKQPGSYPYVNGMRVVNAVALAGGFTYRAKESGITITRGGANSEPIEVDPTTTVQPGDVIEVPERFF